MATLTVTEFASGSFLVGSKIMVLSEPSLRTSAIATSASASTAALGAGAKVIEMVTDIGAWVKFGSSGSTTVATSTNSQRFLANVTYQRVVNPYMRLTVVST